METQSGMTGGMTLLPAHGGHHYLIVVLLPLR